MRFLISLLFTGVVAVADTTTFEVPEVSGVPTSLTAWSGFSPVVRQYGAAQVQDAVAGAGFQSLEMGGGSAVAWSPDEVVPPSGRVLVSSFLVRFDTFSSDGPVIPVESLGVVIFVNSTGLMALDGDGLGGGSWQVLQGLVTDTFYELTITRDHDAQIYSVALDGNLLAENLGFKDSVVRGPSTLTLETSKRTWLDEVAVAYFDFDAPTPNPMSFQISPVAAGSTSITMTANEAGDPSGPVEYFFECLTPGGNSSGWQLETSYQDSGLVTGNSYTYRVKARDASGNETLFSESFAATPELDATSPRIFSLSPSNGASGVEVTTGLILTFNEMVEKGSGLIFIRESEANAVVAEIEVNEEAVVINDSRVAITLPEDLGNGTRYYVEVENGAFADLSGNEFPGLAGAGEWKFTTALGSRVSIYEPFDYTPTNGSLSINGLNGGIGFSGPWFNSHTGTNPSGIVSGESFGSLPVAGGALQRVSRFGSDATARVLSGATQALLTRDETTRWFSVLMKSGADRNGFAVNTYATLILGDTGLAGGAQAGTTGAPAIRSGGNAVGVGFAGTQNATSLYGDVRIQGVTYQNGVSTIGRDDRIVVGESLVMIVGRIDWAVNGVDDVLRLYRISDPGNPLPAPFTTMTVDLDQSAFDTISIGDAQTSLIDEIRFGESLAAVVGNGDLVGGFDDYISNPIFALEVNERGFNQDPDGDGLENGLEAWLGSDPGDDSPVFSKIESDGMTSSFDHPYQENRPVDVAGYYQWSPNLVDWYFGDGVDGPSTGGTVTLSRSLSEGTATVTAVASDRLETLFLRIGVTRIE